MGLHHVSLYLTVVFMDRRDVTILPILYESLEPSTLSTLMRTMPIRSVPDWAGAVPAHSFPYGWAGMPFGFYFPGAIVHARRTRVIAEVVASFLVL